tara:strand:+ start:366 stop:1175 length:810 start_codon:yes stop_codon:yes gene_type:complete
MINKLFLIILSTIIPTFLKASDSKQNYVNSQSLLISSSEYCQNAKNFEKCMEYLKKSKLNPPIVDDDVNCINYLCTPEEARIYGTDNLGLKTLRGYYFRDRPDKRASIYYSKPLKLKVNGNYGRFAHINTIIRYYSKGFRGSINTIQINPDSFPIITGSSGSPPGIRQLVNDYIFDCEKAIFTKFEEGKQVRSKTESGKKKKWVDFSELGSLYISIATKTCPQNDNSILSLEKSFFTKFKPKLVKQSSNKNNLGINCNSPVWRDRPQCN